MRKQQKRSALAMSGILLLAPLTVSASSQGGEARAQVELLVKEYNAVKSDEIVAIRLSRLNNNYYPSEQDKKEYFYFLHEAATTYDEYAEALLSCWKLRQCHAGSIKDNCLSFSKRIDNLAKLDRLETKDAMKKEVDALLGEDDYADYIPFQTPKVTFYLAVICRNYRYQAYLSPDTQPP
jgi:hypothetical protein